jgi:hypothetical protein
MTLGLWRAVAVALLVGGSIVPILAHHSFAAEYDRNKPITLVGVVTKVEWQNPHIYFYVDVKGRDGGVEHWAVEGRAPSALYRAGWRKDSVPVGQQVTVEGWLAKSGAKLANLQTVTLADGRRVLSGSEAGAN